MADIDAGRGAQNFNDLVLRQLDRLEERTRDLVTRADLEALRKELVARDTLEPQLSALRAEIARLERDRISDRVALEKDINEVKSDLLSKQDRLWLRIGQVAAFAAFALTLLGFLMHLKFLP